MSFSPASNWVRSIILIIISIIVGILTGVAFSNMVLLNITGVARGVAILSTVFLTGYVATTVLSYFMESARIRVCLSGPGILLLISSLGSIVVSFILGGIALSSASLPVTIIVGIGGFFFSLMILSAIFFVVCLATREETGC